MADSTRNALADREAETAAIIAEVEAAFEAYGRSIDRGLALAAEMCQLADSIDAGLGDTQAELMEWF